MRVLLSRRDEQRGVVAVLVALLAVVLLVMLAFATDLGMAYAQRQALRSGADSAALAIVRSEYTKQLKDPNRLCNSIVLADDAAAASIALGQVNANAPFGQPLSPANIQVSLSCVGAGHGALQASVKVTKKVPRTFGKVAGSADIAISGSSVANLAVVNQVKQVEPLGLCRYQAQTIIDDAAADLAANKPYRAELVSPTKVWTGSKKCDGVDGSGNWGWLNLDNAGVSSSVLGDKLVSGSTTPLTLLAGPPPYLDMTGTPGNKANSNPVHVGMAAIMDKTVVLPIYDTYSANGSNATYKVHGFLTVKMCGYDNAEKGGCYDPTVPMSGNDLQVRFVSYAPVGKLDTLCDLGDPTCSFDSLAIGLTG